MPRVALRGLVCLLVLAAAPAGRADPVLFELELTETSPGGAVSVGTFTVDSDELDALPPTGFDMVDMLTLEISVDIHHFSTTLFVNEVRTIDAAVSGINVVPPNVFPSDQSATIGLEIRTAGNEPLFWNLLDLSGGGSGTVLRTGTYAIHLPEPAAHMLLVAALAGLAVVRVRRAA
jgi:hypothetical protein